jgi:hypothetical protein
MPFPAAWVPKNGKGELGEPRLWAAFRPLYCHSICHGRGLRDVAKFQDSLNGGTEGSSGSILEEGCRKEDGLFVTMPRMLLQRMLSEPRNPHAPTRRRDHLHRTHHGPEGPGIGSNRSWSGPPPLLSPVCG